MKKEKNVERGNTTNNHQKYLLNSTTPVSRKKKKKKQIWHVGISPILLFSIVYVDEIA